MENGYCYNTAIGKVVIVEKDNFITKVYMGEDLPSYVRKYDSDLIKSTFKELEEYLEGNRKEFDLPLKPEGTEFQEKVWKALQQIPYGETNSYKDIAIKVGNEKAARAVGMANNKNPILILIPCHRVIGANGKLVGYACGIDIKKRLLELEGVLQK